MLTMYNPAMFKKFDVLKTIFDRQREGLKRDTYYLDVPSTTKLCEELKAIVQDTITRYAVPHLSSMNAAATPNTSNPNTPTLATLSTQNLAQILAQKQEHAANQLRAMAADKEAASTENNTPAATTPPSVPTTTQPSSEDFSKMLGASIANSQNPTAVNSGLQAAPAATNLAGGMSNNMMGMGGFSAFLGAPGIPFLQSQESSQTASNGLNMNTFLGFPPGMGGLGVTHNSVKTEGQASNEAEKSETTETSSKSELASLEMKSEKSNSEERETSAGALAGDDFNFYFDLESPISSPRLQPNLDSLGIKAESPVERKKRRIM